MAAELEIRHYDTAGARGVYDTLVAVYAEVYASEAREFFSVPRYRQQLDSHLQVPRFELVTGSLNAEVVGYIYGFALPPGSGWWKGLQTPVPDDLLQETGSRTFAISEVMVREPWRRQGIATQLHGAILRGRAEDRATMLLEPDNPAMRGAAFKWRWHKIGELIPAWPDAPLYEAFMLNLTD